MYSMILAIRRDVEGWFVEGETSEPALAAGTRFSALLKLDVHGAGQLPVRDLGELRQYGEMLGKALFVGDVRAAFHEVLSRLPQGDVLHISLSVEDAELGSLRWERLCCPLHNREGSSWEFLHLRQETAYSLDLRSPNGGRRYPAISRVGLKALVVVADMGPTRPYKLAEFNASETVAGIRAALGEEIPCHVLASSGASQLPDTDGLPTLGEICRWLTRERFAILHLVCHGEFKQWEELDEDKNPVPKSDTFLYLRKSGAIDPTRKDDHAVRISGTEFLQRLSQCQALPHLAFLCSCSSASAEAEQGLGGLGQRLVRELAMPAVVAMTEPVPIDLATDISNEFYHHLRQTGEVDRALTMASASQADRPTVLVPTHFSRLAGRRLFDDSVELTTAEWEHGLNRLPDLIQERAPVLATTFEKLVKVIQPALKIWRGAERTDNDKRTEDEKQAGYTLLTRKAELNELCQDFLENSFDHLAKNKPLSFPTYDGRCPFPGLGVFDKVKTGDKEEDFRPFFFGRDPLIREVRELLNRNRFVAVLGGSGSGKSSLIRAGLLEAMRREKPELQAIVFPPGKDPLVRLQTELAAAPNPDILVVDQFEELFTLCTDLVQRKEFLKQLLPLKAQFPVVITMRADFLGECAGHDDLHQLLDAADDKHLKLIQPLKGNELRSVVELQAQAVGLRFEPGLAASIFDDLESEPGAMPLLQHCLRQLWQHRHGRWLRLAEYANEDRVGGVKGAISRTAEDVYHQLVKEVPEASPLLPFIFERLARIDTSATDIEQRRDTRRREELTELTPAGSDPQVVKLIVTKLADAKLIVTTQNPQTHATEVEVAHEALIRNWPRLQTWLDAARDTARLVERIRNDAGSYHTTPTSDNLTLRGAVLAEAETLLPKVPRRLNESEEHFVRDCRKHETTLKNAEDRRRTRIIIVLACGLAVAIGLGITAYRQRNSAIRLANDNGTLATQNKTLATTNGQLAETERRLRIEADLARGDTYGAMAQLLLEKPISTATSSMITELSKNGWRLSKSSDSWNAMQRVPLFSHVGGITEDELPFCDAIGSSSTGLLLIESDDNKVRVHDYTETSNPTHKEISHTDRISAIALSGKANRVAVGDASGEIVVFDIYTGVPTQRFKHEGAISQIAMSQNGDHLVASSLAGIIRAWSIESEDKTAEVSGHSLDSQLVVSNGGRYVAFGNLNRSVSIACVSEGSAALSNVLESTGPLTQIAFSLDGQIITVAERNGAAKVFCAESLHRFCELPPQDVGDATLSSDGTFMAIYHKGNGSDNDAYKIRVVSLTDRLEMSLGSENEFRNISFLPDGITLVIEEESVSGAGAVSHVNYYTIESRRAEIARLSQDGSLFAMALSDSGKYLTTVNIDGGMRVLDIQTGEPVKRFPRGEGTKVVAMACNGEEAALADDMGRIRLWTLGLGEAEKEWFVDKRVEAIGLASGEDTLFCACEDLSFLTFSLAGGNQAPIANEHEWDIESPLKVVFSEDCKCAAVTDGETLEVRRVADFAKVFTADVADLETDFDSISAMGVSNDGGMVVIGQVSGVASFYTNTGDQPRKQMYFDAGVSRICLERDGSRVYISSLNGVAYLISSQTLTEEARINHAGRMFCIAVDDGDVVATAGDDGSIRLWSADLDDVPNRISKRR